MATRAREQPAQREREEAMKALTKSTIQAAAFVVAAASFEPQSSRAAEPIRIGAFVSASGPGSFLGDPEAKTFKLDVERIDREGGVLGRQLKLTLYDTGSDPKQAVSFA